MPNPHFALYVCDITVRSPTEVRLSGSADGGEFEDVSYSATFVLAVEFTAEYPETAPEARLIECTGYLENNAEALSTVCLSLEWIVWR